MWIICCGFELSGGDPEFSPDVGDHPGSSVKFPIVGGGVALVCRMPFGYPAREVS